MNMSYTSLAFFLLTACCVVSFYVVPARSRWIVLLGFSWLYYVAAGPALILYLLFAIITTWVGAGFAARGRRIAVAIPLLLDFGMLAWLKYSNFAVSCLNHIPGVQLKYLHFLLPLGISFYTFQSAGYLLDVYWKRCEPEKSLLRYALFVSFFPQLMQGPIGRYDRLMPQLAKAHSFDPDAIRRGFWRITWGLCKKMIVADNAALYVDRIFGGYADIRSLGLQGVLLYSVQLYADFSGGIDIAIGIAQMLGIRLDENFRQPYFASSLADFWHRWHITLGTWMKDYLFYPITLSEWMHALRRSARKRFGKELGRAIPVCISNIIIFVVVGIWHGPAWHYIAYGVYNGLIIGISGLLTGTFRKWKKALHVRDEASWYKGFCILRTFVIVNISWYLDRCPDVGMAWQMFRESFRGRLFSILIIDPADPRECMFRFAALAAGCLMILVVSILREKKKDVLGSVVAMPAPLRVLLWTCLLAACALCTTKTGGGFIYANF